MDLQTILEDPTGYDGITDNKLIITDVMRTASDRIYLTINGLFDVQLNKTDEGIVIDVFSCNPDGDADESIGSTWVLDSEVMSEDEWDEAHRLKHNVKA